jgi:hypothetical protein
MASDRQWADAFFAQAQEDLRGANVQMDTPSVLCMLLQMVLEKMAKAALLRSGQMPLRKAVSSHSAASRLVAVLKRQYLEPLGEGNPYAWKDVLPLLQELERAHPQLAGDGPKLEYPWEDSIDGSIRWPAHDLPIVKRMNNPRDTSAPRLLRFAGLLVQQFDALFP